jgi:hypothetical protein
MMRTAKCSCGQLAVTMEGEPNLVAACSDIPTKQRLWRNRRT